MLFWPHLTAFRFLQPVPALGGTDCPGGRTATYATAPGEPIAERHLDYVDGQHCRYWLGVRNAGPLPLRILGPGEDVLAPPNERVGNRSSISRVDFKRLDAPGAPSPSAAFAPFNLAPGETAVLAYEVVMRDCEYMQRASGELIQDAEIRRSVLGSVGSDLVTLGEQIELTAPNAQRCPARLPDESVATVLTSAIRHDTGDSPGAVTFHAVQDIPVAFDNGSRLGWRALFSTTIGDSACAGIVVFPDSITWQYDRDQPRIWPRPTHYTLDCRPRTLDPIAIAAGIEIPGFGSEVLGTVADARIDDVSLEDPAQKSVRSARDIGHGNVDDGEFRIRFDRAGPLSLTLENPAGNVPIGSLTVTVGAGMPIP
jgi:hypothetical protein